MSNSADPMQPDPQQPQGQPVPPPYPGAAPGPQPSPGAPGPQSYPPAEQAPQPVPPYAAPQPYPPQGQTPQGAFPLAGGQIPPGYPRPPAPGAPQPRSKRGLMWALIIGGAAVVLVIAAVVIVALMQQRAAEQAAADRAEAVAGVVSGYLEAVAAGDAEKALGYLALSEESPLLTDEALAVAVEAAPITGIDVPAVDGESDQHKWSVPASYTIGDQQVDATFSVSDSSEEGEYRIIGGLGTVYVPSGFGELGLTVNGIAIEDDIARVFPGAYEVALGDDRFELSGTTSLVVTAPDEAQDFIDLQVALTDDTTAELRSALKKEVDGCVASKKLKAGCGLTLSKTMNSGDVTLKDGTVKRSLPGATKATLKKVGLTVSAGDPLIVTSDYIGSVDVEADGTSKSGQSGRYEIYFGGPSLGSATIDLSGDEPEITWDD